MSAARCRRLCVMALVLGAALLPTTPPAAPDPAPAASALNVRGATPVRPAVDEGKRVALVVGVGAYPGRPLDNPVRDAQAMAKRLAGLGFKPEHLIVALNPTRAAMQRALSEFGDKLSGAAVGLFYFAGHGSQFRGDNYLLPSEVDPTKSDEVRFNSVSLADVLLRLKDNGARANVVILDACRTELAEGAARGSGAGGLAAVREAPIGTLIAYATSPGRVALDGRRGSNGLYTARLLEALDQPGLTIEEAFKQTREAVANDTQGQQVPWENTSLIGTLILKPGPPGAAPPVRMPPSEGGGPSRAADAPPAAGKRRAFERFRDCAQCPEMVALKPGELLMGSPDDEPGRHPREGPQQRLSLARPMAMARFELSVAEYRACVLDTPRPGDPPDLLCSHWPRQDGAGHDLPAGGLSWIDAETYVRWLAHRTGKAYRLPSEAEWEYAARAGSSTARPWGPALDPGRAVCRDCGPERPEGPAAARDGRSANAWGLHDMLGNLWEWTLDCRNDSLARQPVGGEARSDGNCAQRVLRGGSWLTEAKGVRSASRSFGEVSRRLPQAGVRVMRPLDAREVE